MQCFAGLSLAETFSFVNSASEKCAFANGKLTAATDINYTFIFGKKCKKKSTSSTPGESRGETAVLVLAFPRIQVSFEDGETLFVKRALVAPFRFFSACLRHQKGGGFF